MQGAQHCKPVSQLVLTLPACSLTASSQGGRPAAVLLSADGTCVQTKRKIPTAAAPAGEHRYPCAYTADACKAPRNLPYPGHRLWGEGAALHHPGASSKAAGMLVAGCGRNFECQAVEHQMCSTPCTAFAGGLASPCVTQLVTSLSLSLALSTPFIAVLQETLKSVIAQYNASQLLTMREVSTATCSAKQAAP